MDVQAPQPVVDLDADLLPVAWPNASAWSHLPETVRVLTDTANVRHRVLIFLSPHWGQDRRGRWYYAYPSGWWYYVPPEAFCRDAHSWWIWGTWRSSRSEIRRGAPPFAERWHRCAWAPRPISLEEQDHWRLGEDL